MPATYTASLRLTKPAVGDTNWGTTVNTGTTDLTDSAIAGYTTVTMTDADYTLTTANGATDEARSMMLNITGTLTAARNVICPTASKLYIIKNATTGGFAITLKTSGGTGISIPNGSSMLLMCNGTNVVDAVTQFSAGAFTNLSYTGTLTGGTGVLNLGSGQFYKDASGNLGLGVTPGTWAAAAKAIEFTFPTYGQDSAGAGFMSFNARESTAGNWVYKSTDQASRFVANNDGSFSFYTAPSGTAGNPITFTQAMTLDASGNLLVGTTTVVSAGGITLYNNVGPGFSLINNNNAAATGYVFQSFRRSSTEIGSITQTGTTAVLYNTTSDQRLKTNIVDAPEASALIDAIKVRSFDWIADNSHQRYGMVAQELQQVAPEAVHAPADPDEMMAVDYSKLVPMLVKEIQSLRARVAALEAA